MHARVRIHQRTKSPIAIMGPFETDADMQMLVRCLSHVCQDKSEI